MVVNSFEKFLVPFLLMREEVMGEKAENLTQQHYYSFFLLFVAE